MPSRATTLLFAAVLFAAGLWLGLEFRPGLPPETQVATVLDSPRPLPEFQLVDSRGQAYGHRALTGQWTLLFMGFTNCGHVCPMTLYTLDQALRQSGVPATVLFVSVDPQRDEPDVIRSYLDGFNPAFAGATGDDAELNKLARALGAPYQVEVGEDRYIVNHSSAVFLIDPDGRFLGLFGAPHDADSIAADLRSIVGA